MPAMAGPALVAAMLLALAGAQKLIDPAMTVGALRAVRLPATPLLVRVGSAVEMVLGVAAIVVGGLVLWMMVALSYLAFGVFVIIALRSGTMIGSCGCFGRDETPPHWSHVVLNGGFGAVAVLAAVTIDRDLVDPLVDGAGQGALVFALAVLGVVLAHAAFVEMPRALAAGRPPRAVPRAGQPAR